MADSDRPRSTGSPVLATVALLAAGTGFLVWRQRRRAPGLEERTALRLRLP